MSVIPLVWPRVNGHLPDQRRSSTVADRHFRGMLLYAWHLTRVQLCGGQTVRGGANLPARFDCSQQIKEGWLHFHNEGVIWSRGMGWRSVGLGNSAAGLSGTRRFVIGRHRQFGQQQGLTNRCHRFMAGQTIPARIGI